MIRGTLTRKQWGRGNAMAERVTDDKALVAHTNILVKREAQVVPSSHAMACTVLVTAVACDQETDPRQPHHRRWPRGADVRWAMVLVFNSPLPFLRVAIAPLGPAFHCSL